MKHDPKRFSIGGYADTPEWEIQINRKCMAFSEDEAKSYMCPHAKSLSKKSNSGTGKVYTYSTWEWVCPRVAVTWNEGGFCSTAICLDCILEKTNG